MSSPIDDFYRLFLVPGANHCNTPGAYEFGQGFGGFSNRINDTEHNILLAIVDWVEGWNAPASITGVDDNLEERKYCFHPQKSVWSGTEWICVS
jgi:feruloyl esterase